MQKRNNIEIAQKIAHFFPEFKWELHPFTTLYTCDVDIAYKYKGKLYRSMKLHPSQFDKIEPVYESFEGWDADICNCKNKSELPKAARDYLEAIEDFLETRICLVSVGREREQTFTIKERKR